MMSWLPLPFLLLPLVLVLDSRPSRSTSTSTSQRLHAAGLAVCLLAIAGSAQAQVGLRLEAGLEGKVRAERWAPLRVTATNSGEPVSGRVELALPGARTAIPLELPSAANKRVETTLIPQLSYQSIGVAPDQAAASLREGNAGGAGGREVASVQIPVKVLPEEVRLLAVCGEGGTRASGSGGLRFLEGVSLAEAGWSLPLEQQQQLRNGVTETAQVPPAQMPLERAGLDAADLLVIRDAAWRQLQPEQRRAVRQWTELGGRLLLCGEDPAGFQDEEGRRLLPVEAAGVRPRAQLTSFPLPGREPIRAAVGQVMTVYARPLPDARVVLRERLPAERPASPLVVSRPAGFGAVLWLGFDPFRVPPRSMEGRRALWSFLISQVTGREVSEPGFPDLADVPAASGPVRSLPHFPAPSRWTLGAFGLLYVLVFGPLNLWLLRRLRRTVRAWLLMPALSLLMTGGVLALGTAWGKARVVFHAVSVLEAMAGSGTAKEQCLAVLFSPTNRAFGLEMEDAAPQVRFSTGDEGSDQPAPSGQYGNRPAASPGTAMPDARDGDLCRWDHLALTLWTIQSIHADLAVDLGNGIRVDLDDRLAGRVVNDTPVSLRGAYLQFHGWRHPLGDLAPGMARAVTRAGWRRHVSQTAGGQADGEAGGPAEFPRGQAESGPGGNDLLGMAGSLLRESGQRPEVVLVAKMPSLAPPIRVPGVARSPAEGLAEGAILLVRRPVSPTAGLPSPRAAAGEGGR